MTDVSFSMNPSPTILASQFLEFGVTIRSFKVPLKKSVQDVMSKSMQKNFDDGGRPPWEPLSADRIRQKSALGQSSNPLIATGKLRRVVGQLNVWDINTDSATVADLPGVPYGFVQNDGNEQHNLPQREFLVIQDDDADKIEDIFAIWIAERAAAAGLFGSVF